MPEFKPAELNVPPPIRVRTGERAQQYFTFHSTHQAGIYQQVPVEQGSQYCFKIWGHSWSSSDDNPFTSDNPLFQKVGIDPFGGEDWTSANIIWGPASEQYNAYGLFNSCAIAQSNQLTVYAYSEPEWAVKHNDVYWDDAELVLYEPAMVIPLANGIEFVADYGHPVVMSREVVIDIPSDPWVSWSAHLENGARLNPSLSATTGVAGENLTITVDSSGFGPGEYTVDLVITSTPHLNGSPTTIPVVLNVLADYGLIALPYLATP